MENEIKLISCPHCGGAAELKDDSTVKEVYDPDTLACVDGEYKEPTMFWVECEDCRAMITGEVTKEKAVESWNKRAMPCVKEICEAHAVSEGYLQEWYQDSIDNTKPPVWTDEHIEEVHRDFYMIPKRMFETDKE